MEDFRIQLTQLLFDKLSCPATAAIKAAQMRFVKRYADRIQKLMEDDAAGLPLFRKQRYQARYWKDRLQKMETASRKADG